MYDADHSITVENNATTNHSFNQPELNIQENFSHLYPFLPKNYRNVLEYIVSFKQKYTSVFPSHSTIAKNVGCCRRTVIRALKKFNEYGWLGWIKRAWKSSIYFVEEAILKLDLKSKNFLKTNFFKKVVTNLSSKIFNPSKVTKDVTDSVTLPSKPSNCFLRNEDDPDVDKYEKIMLYEIKELSIPHIEKINLTKMFNERILRLALEDYYRYRETATIDNLVGYLIFRCVYYRNKILKKHKKPDS